MSYEFVISFVKICLGDGACGVHEAVRYVRLSDELAIKPDDDVTDKDKNRDNEKVVAAFALDHFVNDIGVAVSVRPLGRW
jgi:hypothetical protein